MDLSKADVLVNELLERSDLQEVLNSVLDRQRPPQATAHSSSSEELRNLFRPSGQSTNVHQGTRYFLRKNLGSWNSHLKNRRCKIPNTNTVFPAFNKDLILLDGPDNATVVKQGKKHVLHEKGHILSAFEFKKEWDNKTVMEKIRQAFGSKIPDDVSLQFLMPCGNKLVIPQLTDNIELTALMIHKVYKQKSIYLMPSRKLFEEILENSDADNVDNTGFFDVDYSNNNIRGFSEEHSLSINTLPRNFTATRENLVQNDTQSSTSDLTSTLEESRKICLSEAYCEIPNRSTAPPHPTNYVGEMVLKNSDAVIEAESSMWSSQIGNETSDDFTLSTHFTYNRYVECLESDTQSDISDEIHLAIQSSLQDQYNVELNEQHSSKEILQDLAQKINHMNTSKFNINRNNVWEGAVRGIRRSSFCPKNNISVKFSDDSGKSEEAVDLGGPRREFFRLLMRYIATSSLFEGTDCTKNLTLDSRGIRENWYFDTGRFISISLVHGGPSPGFFSETLYKSIAYGPETIQPSLDDVFDFEIASKIKKFADCSTVEELKTLINENLDFLSNAGCLRTVTVVNDKSWLVKDLLMFHVIHRVRGPFESLLKGLETLGVLQQIKLYPNSFLQLFCHKPLPLTADVIDNLFQIRFSLKGSNTFLVEQRIVSYWRDFLQDVEERQTSATLDGILAFATGADCTPPLGFEPSPSIEFLHSTSSLLPLANTCINCLKLPIHSNFTDFKSNMDFAFINTQGFGKQ